MAIVGSAKPSKEYNGKVRMITFVGFIGIGTICASLTYNTVDSWECFHDPEDHNYIEDPLQVAHLAFWLCGSIAYGWLMLLDHTSDVLLYCYAWNKKHKKGNIDKYIPDDLRNVVGVEDKNTDSYPLYGNAPSNMYLGTWTNIASAANATFSTKKAAPAKKKEEPAPTASQAQQGMSSSGPGGPYRDAYGSGYGDFQQGAYNSQQYGGYATGYGQGGGSYASQGYSALAQQQESPHSPH